MPTCAMSSLQVAPMSSTVALHLTHPAFQNPVPPLIILGIRPELLIMKYSFSDGIGQTVDNEEQGERRRRRRRLRLRGKATLWLRTM